MRDCHPGPASGRSGSRSLCGLLSAVCVLGKLAAVPDGHSDVFVAAQGLLAWVVGEGDVRGAQAVDQVRGPRGVVTRARLRLVLDPVCLGLRMRMAMAARCGRI